MVEQARRGDPSRRRVTTVSLEPGVRKLVELYAIAHGTTVSAIANAAIKMYLAGEFEQGRTLEGIDQIVDSALGKIDARINPSTNRG